MEVSLALLHIMLVCEPVKLCKRINGFFHAIFSTVRLMVDTRGIFILVNRSEH